MDLKGKYIVIICVFIFTLTFGCSNSKEEIMYDFPLDRDVVEQVISEQQLTWHIEDEQSFYEGHSVFSLRDEDNVFCSIDSRDGELGRLIALQFHFPHDYTSEQIKQFNEEEWFNLFEIAGTFYGNTKDIKKVYNKFLDYLEDRNSKENTYGYFTKRIDDIHYRVKLAPFRNDSSYYKIVSLEILNSEAYEKRASAIAEAQANRAKREDIKVVEDICVSDIIEISIEDTVLQLIVQGHLKDIRKLKKMPKTFQEALNNHYEHHQPHKDDYLTAKLVDDTGSINVFLLATSLNSRELGQDRNHHITYYTKDKISVITLSPVIEK